jgi:integrase
VHQSQRTGRQGIAPKFVQQLLGHGSIVMTLDRYGHLFPRGDDRNELSKAVSVLLA